MAKIPCGSVIRRLGVTDDPGTAGCLVQFPDDPEKLFWLTAGHVLVGRTAKQFDPVEAKDLPAQTIGLLYGWTSLGGPTTTDAAIVQVHPELVLPEIGTLGVPKGTNVVPKVGEKLTIFAMGETRSGTIEKIGVDMPISMVGPDFEQTITYVNQIRCGSFSVDGCSGAIAIDENGDAVGMVVAGDGSSFTLVTPIDALLSHPDWGQGPPLEIQASVPSTAKAPFTATPTPPQLRVPDDVGPQGTSLPQRALNFFVAQGWTRAQALGLVANIQAESSFNIKAPGDGGAAFGLCQWHPDRQANFFKLFGHHIQDSTFAEQLTFVNFELRQGTETDAGARLSRQTTAAQAAEVVSTFYERPADTRGSEIKRAAIANSFDRTLV
jgi:Phage tail lysozyme